MKILLVHNYYKQRGGEDVAFEGEANLLASAGFCVDTFSVKNDAIDSTLSATKSALTLYGASKPLPELIKRLKDSHPDVVHFHNVFPLISTSAFRAVRAQGCAVVHTIHNFRPICAAGTFFRDGQICELCLVGTSYHAVLHKCYRHSRVGSAVLAGAIAYDRGRNLWTRDLDAIFALTNFAKTKLVKAGLPADKLVVKSNSVADPGPSPEGQTREGFLYVGRLSPEKGVSVLLEAAGRIDQQFTICGDGPQSEQLRSIAGRNVRFTGAQSYSAVQQLMRGARALVIPSLWYEGFPMTAVEALAHGTPVVGSNIGSLAEIIQREGVGHVFEMGNATHLSEILQVVLASSASAASAAARQAYTTRFSEKENLACLEKTYLDAIERRRAGLPPAK